MVNILIALNLFFVSIFPQKHVPQKHVRIYVNNIEKAKNDTLRIMIQNDTQRSFQCIVKAEIATTYNGAYVWENFNFNLDYKGDQYTPPCKWIKSKDNVIKYKFENIVHGAFTFKILASLSNNHIMRIVLVDCDNQNVYISNKFSVKL